MKNLYLLPFLCFFLIPSFVEAQAPEGINYQAMYRNASGAALPNHNINVRININQGASNGSLVYTERHKTKTNGQGLFNIIVGNGLSPDDFSSIDWSFGPYFMHIEIEDIDLSQNIYFGFQQLLSVPYALHAKVADSIAGGSSGSGEDGLSAYEIAVQNGFLGTEVEWLASLQGTDGQDGVDGLPGQPGADGQDGVDGLPGQPGADGQDGADGLPGQPGADGQDGADGLPGQPGADGQDGADGAPGQPGADGQDGADGAPGQPGADGQDGADGLPGQPGADGQDGADGLPGQPGADGQDGADGAPGQPGADGQDGADGLPGQPGADGQDGADGLPGQPGADGQDGADGLPGQPGADGQDGADGLPGQPGADGQDGADGAPGQPGADGQDGADGLPGQPGADGQDGADGLSAYEIAVQNGFVGTEAEWLASLQGTDGQDGADGQGGVTQAGTNVTITGDGTPTTPYIIDAIQTISTNGSPGNLSLNDGGGTITINVNDGDDSATNELQDISTNGAPGNISISDGSTINLNIDDADFDPFNEITTVVDNGNGTSTITDVLGGSVIVDNDGIDNVDDADNDPTNEWNTGATFNNNILEIQDAGGIVTADLSILDNSGTDDQNISGSSLTGTILKIGIENGASETVDLSSLQDGVDDADNDPTNEWNTGVALNGSELEITDLGGTLSVDLEDLEDNDWYKQPVGSNEQTSSISDEIYTNSNVLINGFGATGPFGSSLTAPNDFNALTIRNGDINQGWKSVSIDLRGINTDAKIIAGNESANLGTNGYFAIQTRKNEILSERFRINSGGNVGINISDPSQLTNKLQVDGSVRFDNLVSSAGTENNGLLLNGLNQVVSRSFDVVAFNGEIDGDITNELQELTISNGTVGITQGNSIELPWQRNDASGEIYPNVLTDKVGIGTNNPEYDLDVQGILASTYLLPNIIDGNSNRSLRIGVPGNYPGGIQWNGSNNTSGESGDLSFLTYNNRDLTLAPNGTGVVKVFNHDLIINSGRVGVNTTSPGTALDVVGVLELSNVAPTDPGADIVRLGDGGSNLQIQTNYGYTKIGPQNATWSHFYTDRSRYFFDKGLTVDGGLIGSYNEDLSIQTSGTTRMTIDNNNGYVGIGDVSPEAKLKIQDVETVPGVTSQISFEIESNNSSLSMGSNADWNWLRSSTGSSAPGSNKPLKLVADGVDIDHGYLNVGGTSASTTRYGVIEFYRAIDWELEDEWQTVRLYDTKTGNQAELKFPDGATQINIYRVEYDITAESSDVDENQFFEFNIGGSPCTVATGSGTCASGTSFARTSWDGGGPRFGQYFGLGDNAAFNINEVVLTSQTISTNDQEVYLTGYDENNGAGQVYIYSAKVKLYYTYTVAAQDGDIVAGGRIYANSETSVGDVAEYFPINAGVEPGLIISYSPESNGYELSETPYSEHIVGVISKDPSVVLNDPSVGPPVALAGRVIVKLVDGNSLIKGGDYITSSSQPGLGKKANREGRVIGYAVKNQEEGQDFVEVLIQPGYWKPQGKIDNDMPGIEERIKRLERELNKKND